MLLIACVAVGACHFPKAQTIPGTPEEYAQQFAGDTPVVLRNATDHPICRLTLEANGKYKGEVLKGFHASPIPPGGSVTLKLAATQFVSIDLETCDHHSGILAYVDIHQPTEIAFVKGKNHVNSPTSLEMGFDDLSQFRSNTPAEPNCKSAGDTSAISGSECCSGTITSYSAKHPGPSHCSFSDE